MRLVTATAVVMTYAPTIPGFEISPFSALAFYRLGGWHYILNVLFCQNIYSKFGGLTSQYA